MKNRNQNRIQNLTHGQLFDFCQCFIVILVLVVEYEAPPHINHNDANLNIVTAVHTPGTG